MSRIVWVLLFLVAAVLLVPPLRERARPQIEWALTPIYRWEAKNRANEIGRTLERERSLGGAVPAPRDLTRFLTEREGARAATDPWGQPFFLERSRTEFRVGSSGQDRTQGTGDDIYSQPRLLRNPRR